MLRIPLCKICSLSPCTQNERIIWFIQQPKDHTLRAKKAPNCAQHLSKELVRCRRSRENIQAVGQRLHLAAGDLLGGAQRSLRAVAFNSYPYKVCRQVDQFEVPRVRTPRFAIVHAENSKDFSGGREYRTRPGGSQSVLQR